MQRLTPYIKALISISNPTENQAKTGVYYSVTTYNKNPRVKPILNLDGESGTGKNPLMEQMKLWCNKPKWIKGENKTSAQMRNELANTRTAFVEEADKTKDQKECENWYKLRYDRSSEETKYTAQMTSTVREQNYNKNLTTNHFGYTVLHTQNPFQAGELDRRIIRITIMKDNTRNYSDIDTTLGNLLVGTIASEIDWNSPIPSAGSGSAWDCWLPLMRVAAHLGDDEFLKYAREQIELKMQEDNLSKVFEPKGIVLGEITSLYKVSLHTDKQPPVAITDVTKIIRNRVLPFYPDERQVTRIAKILGFPVYYPGGKAYIKVISEEHLAAVLSKHSIEIEVNEEVEVLLKSLRLSTPSST